MLGGCDFYFDHNLRSWTFGSEPCSVWLQYYIDMAYNVGLFVIIAIFDISTTIQLTKRRMTISISEITRQNSSALTQHRELWFFIQAALNSIIFAFMLVCFHLISPTVTIPLLFFISSTFVWAASHTSAGLILVLFNPEIRRHFRSAQHFSSIFKSLDTVQGSRTA
ncbi:hypothetical protein DICVIV_08098 [Dictyocaulus viviparus]|uniref:7TM GPCR serpentine receptor class x (Srx) domain-containing protein n=1 Tax=Dictyocaulus viviparus TaxID=29172 RepID=A0A0D8XMI6_DICVI|nr:hypothetical protein DICVIV_08098 [Dictyocaulus viviparus]